jgi:hypothetical protein
MNTNVNTNNNAIQEVSDIEIPTPAVALGHCIDANEVKADTVTAEEKAIAIMQQMFGKEFTASPEKKVSNKASIASPYKYGEGELRLMGIRMEKPEFFIASKPMGLLLENIPKELLLPALQGYFARNSVSIKEVVDPITKITQVTISRRHALDANGKTTTILANGEYVTIEQNIVLLFAVLKGLCPKGIKACKGNFTLASLDAKIANAETVEAKGEAVKERGEYIASDDDVVQFVVFGGKRKSIFVAAQAYKKGESPAEKAEAERLAKAEVEAVENAAIRENVNVEPTKKSKKH